MQLNRKVLLALFLILGAALALRYAAIGRQSIWLDESFTWWFASGPLARALHAEPTNPPLYFTLANLWVHLFGQGEGVLRGLSVVPSLVSVWLTYLLAGRLFTRSIALLSAGYLAISTFQIYFAQEARCYSMLACFVLAAGLALWNAVTSESRKQRAKWYALYTLFAILACYTHFVAVFFLAGHGLFVLFRRTRQVFWVSAAIGTALVVYVPWILTMLHTASKGGQIRRYLALKFPQAYFSFLFGDSLIPMDDEAVRHIAQGLAANWAICLAVAASLLILARYFWLAWKRWGEAMQFVVVMCTAPLILAFLMSLVVKFFDRRYMFPAAPFVCMMIAASVWEVAQQSRERGGWQTRLGWAAIATYGILLGISLYHYYFVPRYGKETWRDAIAYIDASASPDGKDLVMLDPDYLTSCYNYYQKRHLPYLNLTIDVSQSMAASPQEVQRRVRGYHKIWLVRSHVESPYALEGLRAALHETSYRKFPRSNGIEIYSFEAGAPAASQ